MRSDKFVGIGREIAGLDPKKKSGGRGLRFFLLDQVIVTDGQVY